jgi:hypothetical protein
MTDVIMIGVGGGGFNLKYAQMSSSCAPLVPH